jgi:hypothetical protein
MISHGTRCAQKTGRAQGRFVCKKIPGGLAESGTKGAFTVS